MTREREVQKLAKDLAKSFGMEFRKTRYEGRVACPDSRILGRCWIEFKGDGGRLSPQQVREIERMRKNGEFVFVARTKEDVRSILERFHGADIYSKSVPRKNNRTPKEPS